MDARCSHSGKATTYQHSEINPLLELQSIPFLHMQTEIVRAAAY